MNFSSTTNSCKKSYSTTLSNWIKRISKIDDISIHTVISILSVTQFKILHG
jgi:hypothetical protein